MGIMASPFKHPKTGVYYCRVSVPKELIETVGKREFKRSLRTKDASEARRLFPSVYSEFAMIIESAKRRLEASVKLSQRKESKPDTLTIHDINVLASRFFNKQLAILQSREEYSFHDMARFDLMAVQLGNWCKSGEFTSEGLAQIISEYDDPSTKTIALERDKELVDCLGAEAEELLEQSGYAVPSESKFFISLLNALAFKVNKLRIVAAEYFSNNFENTAKESLADAETSKPNQITSMTITKGTSIVSLFNDYEEDLKLRKKGQEKTLVRTIKDYSIAIKRFAEFSSDKPMEDVDARDIAEFRALLLRVPSRPSKSVSQMPLVKQVEYAKANHLPLLSPKTVRKQLMCLSAVFEFAKEQAVINTNPVQGSTKRLSQMTKKKSGVEKEYSKVDLIKIFSSPLYTEGYRPPRANHGEAVYWVPLLAYYTGARSEEITQLYTADIKQEDGIFFINMVADKADKTLKNNSSIRKVPLHKDLLDLGFLDYVNELGVSSRLFPELKVGADGRYSFAIGKWFALHFRESLGVNDSVRPLHAFRHSFKTIARQSGMPKDIHDVLTGHSSGDVSGSYGHYPLKLLYDEINKIPTVPVDLSQIRWSKNN